jgi:hypothetical protein
MADVDTCGRQVQRATRVGRCDDGRPAASDGFQLSGANVSGHLRMQRGVRTARAAAQAVIVELDQLPDKRSQHRADMFVHSLHVAEVTRVVDRDTSRGDVDHG